MELVNRVSAFENCQFSDIIVERMKRGSEKSKPMKKQVSKTQWLCFGYGVMMIMPKEESE